MTHNSEIEKIKKFIIDSDNLKSVIRKNYNPSTNKLENVAEHSWQLALCVLIMHSFSEEPIDLLKAIKMSLIHDLCEIHAGDTYAFDDFDSELKHENERKSLIRLLEILPKSIQDDLLSIWDEFEESKTPTAKFVQAVDQFIPELLNHETKGRSYQENEITFEKARSKKQSIKNLNITIHELLEKIHQESNDKGYFHK